MLLVRMAFRTLVLTLAFTLVPGSITHTGGAPRHLCASEARRCVFELGSKCEHEGKVQFDAYQDYQ